MKNSFKAKENPSISDVKSFWDSNPLWTGESKHKPGTVEFFEEHRDVVIKDCFAGALDSKTLPPFDISDSKDKTILDLGCGVGFWTSEFAKKGYKNLFAADLTKNAISITKKRLKAYNLSANTFLENAETMSFDSNFFDHVNCQGVIHHTPNTEKAISEIYRVLKPGGTASISVYNKNIFHTCWPYLRWIGVPLAKLGGGLKGRGRENIFLQKNVSEIVRVYDGAENPIGKYYSKNEFKMLLKSKFHIEDMFLHFFPARSLPFEIPQKLHRFLDTNFGFMIYANVKKPCAE